MALVMVLLFREAMVFCFTATKVFRIKLLSFFFPFFLLVAVPLFFLSGAVFCQAPLLLFGGLSVLVVVPLFREALIFCFTARCLESSLFFCFIVCFLSWRFL